MPCTLIDSCQYVIETHCFHPDIYQTKWHHIQKYSALLFTVTRTSKIEQAGLEVNALGVESESQPG
jgi:hypothetical protein